MSAPSALRMEARFVAHLERRALHRRDSLVKQKTIQEATGMA